MREQPTKEQRELGLEVDALWQQHSHISSNQWHLLDLWRSLGERLRVAGVSHGKVMTTYHFMGYELHKRLGMRAEALRQLDESDATFSENTPIDLAKSAVFKFSYSMYELRDQQMAAAYLETALKHMSSEKVKKAVHRWTSLVLEDHLALLFNERLAALIGEASGVGDLVIGPMLGSELKALVDGAAPGSRS